MLELGKSVETRKPPARVTTYANPSLFTGGGLKVPRKEMAFIRSPMSKTVSTSHNLKSMPMCPCDNLNI
jgi:hypothetical protein